MITEESVRANFPSLGQDQIYLDNAGGSQILGVVVNSIKEYLTGTNVQLGGSYPIGKKSNALYAAAYQAGSKYINANPDEVVFGPSTTQLFRTLSFALNAQPGDEVIVTKADHEANVAPWVDMADRLGMEVKWWQPRSKTDPRMLSEELEQLISPKTKLVACAHVNNVLGTINDIKAIAQVAHNAGALICVDGVAYAPHRPIDVKDLGVDFYGFSWYKVYGPHIALLYGSKEAQSHMRSLGHFFNPHVTMSDKMGLAATSYEMAQAVPLIVDYLGPSDSSMWQYIKGQEQRLQAALLDYLRKRSDITIYGVNHGDPELRVPTISFTAKGWNSRELVEAVESKSNFGFRWGAFYSNRLVREVLDLGEDGVVRISLVHYNTSMIDIPEPQN